MSETKKNKRTKYCVEMNEFYKFAALLNSGGVNRPWSMSAIQLLKNVLYAQKGTEKRPITDKEATDMIERGYKLTG